MKEGPVATPPYLPSALMCPVNTAAANWTNVRTSIPNRPDWPGPLHLTSSSIGLSCRTHLSWLSWLSRLIRSVEPIVTAQGVLTSWTIGKAEGSTAARPGWFETLQQPATAAPIRAHQTWPSAGLRSIVSGLRFGFLGFLVLGPRLHGRLPNGFAKTG